MKVFSALVVATVGLAAVVSAGEPTDQVRARVEQIYRTFNAAPVAERHTAIRPTLDQLFDWTEMAKRALGRHWQGRTAAEQTEFVRLFAEVFERAYVSQIKLADADQSQYSGETVEGARAIVRTRITTKRGSEIPVDYLTQRDESGHWKVYDFTTGGVSLVGNYRTQFNAIINRSSYQALVEKLKGAALQREQ